MKIDEIKEKRNKIIEEMQSLLNKKVEYEQKYIEKKHELKKVNIELAQKLRETKPKRRKFPKPSTEFSQEIINETGKCEECGAKEKLTLHHIKKLAEGGSNERENLKVLCLNCHRKYHPIDI